MPASVPEETKRTSSTEGSASLMAWASSISSTVGAPKLVPRAAVSRTMASTPGSAWPRIIGPHEPTRSTYELPSASSTQAPWARAMNSGWSRPTARMARTGDETPPGIWRQASAYSARDRASTSWPGSLTEATWPPRSRSR